ncbi:GNAT family N-acetyltransferase [Nocardioides campestrisoli]|uniref:GNAT family N-acetyltransferase n=1 Tax=Nocardioides campestrisoli TaxID=2736757 RepID=UPI0015E6CD2E|nr:GNAT family N-acetyltransferase [Nocardioides campestrisoli]
MSRKVVRLTLDHLPRLDEHVRTCLRWQLDPVARGRVAPPERADELSAWVSEVLREWGSCGRVALNDDEVVGAVLYAPPAFLPGGQDLPTWPPTPDAVMLAQLYVTPEARGGGWGRMLVQGLARDLVQREQVALEAFGDTRGLADDGTARACVLPAEFLGAVGFKTQRAHSTTPRMRMELRTTRAWMSDVEQALERLVGAVRPALKPQQGRSVRSGPRAP